MYEEIKKAMKNYMKKELIEKYNYLSDEEASLIVDKICELNIYDLDLNRVRSIDCTCKDIKEFIEDKLIVTRKIKEIYEWCAGIRENGEYDSFYSFIEDMSHADCNYASDFDINIEITEDMVGKNIPEIIVKQLVEEYAIDNEYIKINDKLYVMWRD